jgi:hypothetical protein
MPVIDFNSERVTGVAAIMATTPVLHIPKTADRPEATGPSAAARPVPRPVRLPTDLVDAPPLVGFDDRGVDRLA